MSTAIDPRRAAMLAEAYAKKIAARASNPENCQRYPANRGAGLVAHINGERDRYQAKLEARVAAFSAGRKPDADGFLDVSAVPAKADAKAPAAASDDAALEAATRPDPRPAKADAKARG